MRDQYEARLRAAEMQAMKAAAAAASDASAASSASASEPMSAAVSAAEDEQFGLEQQTPEQEDTAAAQKIGKIVACMEVRTVR